MRAVIYARVSRDTGSSSLLRQQTACEQLCTAREWSAVGSYVDNDTSAYLERVRRPEYDRLLEDIASGAVDMVVVFKIDRLVRRPLDFERFLDAALPHGTNLTSVTEPIDSTTPHGVAFIRILVALAGLESATNGLRLSAQRREEALAGRRGPSGAYGFNADWSEVVEDEAALIREATRRVMDGERIAAITNNWRRNGVPGPGGRPWSNSALNRILHNPRLVGDRAYHGTVVASGCFPAILDRATFAELQIEMGQPQRRGSPVKHSPRLMSGLIRCGRCGAKLMQATRNGRLFYSCPQAPTGCGRLHINADYADDWLRRQLCDRLATSPGPCELDTSADVTASLAELSVDYYARRLITREEFLAARAKLESHPPPPSRDLARLAFRLSRAADPPGSMATYGIETQRALLRTYIERIEVSPAPRRGVFNPNRLTITWRG